MIKKIFAYMAVLFTAFASLSCSGTLDDGSDDVVPEGVLRIFADKTSVMADGNDAVTFKVMFGSEDVSNQKTLQIIRIYDGEEKYMAYGVNKFSTVTPGTYRFKAKYYYGGNHVTDNEVEVVAESYFSGETKSYKRRFLGTLFTSTGCPSCPGAAAGLKGLQEENPGLISLVAFHQDYSTSMPDPMTIPATEEVKSALGGFQGLPAFFWNMRKESYTGGSQYENFYAETLAAEMERYEVFSGVAISTSLDKAAGKMNITAGVTSNMPKVFRYLVVLVEDGITGYEQMTNAQSDKEYVHDNVVRAVLTSAHGDKLNDNLPLSVGVEAKATKTVTIEKGWNVDDMRVIVAAMSSDDDGYTWTVNNVSECKAGESVDYSYEE